MSQLFLAGVDEASQKLSIMTAKSGSTVFDDKTGKRYLVLQQGRQYRGQPGDANYEIIDFDTYQQFIPQPTVDTAPKKPSDSMTTSDLMQLDSVEARAALQWRISLPVLVMIVAFLAVPLSRTNPRQGRLSKLIPAILLYIFYLVLVNSARGAMESGKTQLHYLIWWVHFTYALLALALFNPQGWHRRRRAKQRVAA
jgi:lipopolysaccharide export system permease protein